MPSTIVSSTENCEQAAAGEPLKAVHHALVGSQNEVYFIVFKESLYSIWSELYDVASTIWVSHKVWLDSKFAVTVSWVTPQDVHHELLLD